MPDSPYETVREFMEAVRLALDAIRTNRLRSSLTLLGVAIGVAVVIAVATVNEGASSYVDIHFTGKTLDLGLHDERDDV